MASTQKPSIVFRDIQTFDEIQQVENLERDVWKVADLDVTAVTMLVACKEAGNILVGAFDGKVLVGFAFGFIGRENGRFNIHSHMLAVRDEYRDQDLGYRLKLVQRDRALAMGIREITWTFDPLQSRNAHLNFSKLGVFSDNYRIDFYGPQTSSVLHQNGTDRLWVRWPITSRRNDLRLKGNTGRAETIEILANLSPLVRFNAKGLPDRDDLQEALARQRIAIEIPSDILAIERANPGLAREWRLATRWAFTEALKAGFFVAEFCGLVRGRQGPGVYVLQKGQAVDYIPEIA
jgi:predicted GNAT superfamily acetyltransferase